MMIVLPILSQSPKVMNIRIVTLLICTSFLAGCAGIRISSAINKYDAAADQVKLGDSKEEVLGILLPTQRRLPLVHSKYPDKYYDNGSEIEIYYMRSGHQGDGLTTDDEFVPYLFENNKLVGIGWHVLGGPKTQGQVDSDTHIEYHN